MKRYFIVVLAISLCAVLCACVGSAENTDITGRYLPEGAEFLRTERDDGFTEYEYKGPEGGRYTLMVDASDNVRALEYESEQRSTAKEVVLTAEEAFAVITAQRPEAVLSSAIEDRDDGSWEWDLLFVDGDEVGFYELDAATGDVLDYDIFYTGGNVIDPAVSLTARIPDATITEISIGADDGRIVYEGNAFTSNGPVEFSIDADTGVIVELEYDD